MLRDSQPQEESFTSPQTVEDAPNFEGNWSEVLFDRMQNPTIRGQLIDLLHAGQVAEQKQLRAEFSREEKRGDGEPLLVNKEGAALLRSYVDTLVDSKEEIEEDYNNRLAQVMNGTSIRFGEDQCDEDTMVIGMRDPHTDETVSARVMSAAEAHEKGHVLRPFEDDFFRDYFAPGFDVEAVSFSEEDVKAIVGDGYRRVVGETDADIIAEHVEYLFSGEEIAERMSQLKNYFGMRGAETFTCEHLDYAREHYLEDIGFDNSMTQFFQAITSETEDEFLRLINASGI